MDYAQAIQQAQAGNEAGFNFLYEKTYKSKYYLALKYMKNEEAAQDVLQDAYIKAFTKLDMLESAEAFPGWLGMIVANTAKNALQKKNPVLFTDIAVDSENENFEYEIEDDNLQNQPELAYTRQETQELVHELLDTLPAEQKMCLLMFYIEEQSIREIAQSLECSENTVKSRLNYGRKNLKAKAEELQKKGYKLYSVAPIALLLYLLRTDVRVMAQDTSVQAAGNRMAGEIRSALQTTGIKPADAVGTTTEAAKTTTEAAKTTTAAAGTTTAAAGTGFLGTMGGKIAAAAVALCLVGGGIAVMTSGSGDKEPADQEIVMQETIGQEENGQDENIQEVPFVPVSEDMYPELIKGNLTQTQLCGVLSGISGSLEDGELSEEELAWMVNEILNDSEYYGIESYGTDDQWRTLYNAPALNRMLSAVTDFQYTEETTPDIVDGDIVAIANSSLSVWTEIVSAEYSSDEMRVVYDWISYDPGGEPEYKVIRREALLKSQEDGLYKIVQVHTVTAEETAEWKQAYMEIIEAVPSQTYQLNDQSIKEPQWTYYLHDMDGDDVPELILSVTSNPWLDDWQSVSFRMPWVGIYTYKEGTGAKLLGEDWYYMPVFARQNSDQSLIIYGQNDIYVPEVVYSRIQIDGEGLKKEEMTTLEIADWSDVNVFNEQSGIEDLKSSAVGDDTGSLHWLLYY